MPKTTAIYFSGTGNTAFALAEFMRHYDPDAAIHSIEDSIDFNQALKQADEIVLAYPIYLSLMPDIMSRFLTRYQDAFKDKTISVICTEELFSGDGAALAIRHLKKQAIIVNHTLHILMPGNITDVGFLLAKSTQEQSLKLQKKQDQIKRLVDKIHAGKTYKHGRRFYSRFLGYILQRSFGVKVVKKLKTKVQIHHSDCIQCGSCVTQCPVDNLSMQNGQVVTHNDCTLCYRCVNICPTKAISILSKTPPKKQYYINKKA